MAAGWSTVVVCIGCAVLGYVARDWQYERATRIEAERQLVIAREQPASQVSDERHLAAVASTRERGKATARAGVSAAPILADCPVPDELGSMLVTQAQATRSTAAGSMPNRPVP